MSARQTSPRAIRKALELLLELPPAALAEMAERLVDRLDATGPDADLEPEPESGRTGDDLYNPPLATGDDDDAEADDEDRCAAADDAPRAYLGDHGIGDEEDAESEGDGEMDADAEPLAVGVPSWVIGAEPHTAAGAGL